MIWLRVLFSFLIPVFLGIQCLKLILQNQKLDKLLTLALAYGLGWGILTHTMLIIGILRIPYTFFNLIVALAAVSLILFLSLRLIPARREEITTSPTNIDPDISRVNIFFKFAIYFFLAYYSIFLIWWSLNIPVYEWDSLATAAYNAKILFFEKNLSAQQYFAHQAYPLFVPFVFTWFSICLGVWEDQIVRLFFPILFFMFAIIFYNTLKQLTSRAKALIGLFILTSSNFLMWQAGSTYRDLPMMYFFCTTVFLLVLWQKSQKETYFQIASIFSAFGTFVKLEGTAYFGLTILLAAYILIQDKTLSLKIKIKNILKYAYPGILLCGIYSLYKIFAGYLATEYLQYNFAHIEYYFTNSIRAFFSAMFFTANWNIVWQILFVGIFINFHKIKTNFSLKTLFLTLMLFIGLYLTLATISGAQVPYTSPFGLSRFLIHCFPISVILIVLLFDNDISLNQETKTTKERAS
ncbi:MAG: glycosyltransferase family 39 protein [Candidatus Omnitrophica bacterium]|nr:glycosyltransferase family 39 protein [Candidatus Omnitrophota bacterium]